MVLTENILFLQLFAEAASGSGEGTTGEKGAESAAEVQVTGDTTPAAGEKISAEKNSSADRKAAYQKLVAEYKDIHDAEMQNVIQKRVKRTQEIADKYTALFPTLELVAERYGVDPHDIEALNKAVSEDKSYYEEEALREGIPVEDLMEKKQIKRENAQLKRENAMYKQRDAQRQREEAAQRTYNGWLDAAEKAKAVYPNLDLKTEVQNPEFVRLLEAGVPVRTAYEVTHRDAILSGAMQYAQNNAAEKLANSVASGQARPAEGGMGQAPTAQTKVDISKLSAQQIREYMAKAARGEKVTFSS